jgi:hypothetical protein
MRAYHYKPRAEMDLAGLGALDDIDMISDAVKELAADRKKRFVIPLQSPFLGPREKLLQYRVGRYKLNYTLTKKELSVRSVMV